MKLNRISALALTGAMLLGLTACGGSAEPSATPEVTATPEVVETVTPTAAPEESVPVESVVPSEKPVESAPAETVTPTETPAGDPVSTPAPEVTPEPTQAPASSVTAAEVYNKVSAVAGGNGMADMGFILEEFYNLSASDLVDYAFYMPEMSTTLEELFIAKVADGKMDSVKAACQSRQQGLKEDADFYPTTAAYIDSYQIVTNGDWIMFAVVQYPDAAVSAFHEATK